MLCPESHVLAVVIHVCSPCLKQGSQETHRDQKALMQRVVYIRRELSAASVGQYQPRLEAAYILWAESKVETLHRVMLLLFTCVKQSPVMQPALAWSAHRILDAWTCDWESESDDEAH